MDFLIFNSFSHYFVLPPVVLLFAVVSYFGRNGKKGSNASTNANKAALSQDVKKVGSDPTASRPTQWYRDMFFQLQNLEDHPGVLEQAREELLAMFSRGLSVALKHPGGNILSIEHYDAKRVWKWIEEEHDAVLSEWGDYLERRKQGRGPELFATADAAKLWLVQQAPVKFVDGAWLAHTHKITSPFALRGVTKAAWQVLSEELGDGDLSKHHVYLYRRLLEAIGSPLPDGHSPEFIKPSLWDGVDNHGAWEAGVGQLLISLFPNEFLPEILGFNMHYELVTLDTMRAAHELKALGINPYYFLIHIAIDNADSGHTAMATHTVTRYLDMVQATEGEEALQQAWKRVQVGYILSQTLGGSHPHEREGSSPSSAVASSGFAAAPSTPLDPLSSRVIDIFKAKASVSSQFHCQSRVRIGGQTLATWLAPAMWAHPNPAQHRALLTALSQAKPWIYPGSSSKSLLLRELSWEGRMFGAFTHDEVVALSAWIDSLVPDDHARPYWTFTGRKPLASKKAVGELQDPARHHPVVMPWVAADKIGTGRPTTVGFQDESISDPELRIEPQPLKAPSHARLPDLIALWFSHIGLVENTINTPSRTASPLYASILRLLRAQAGFAIENHIVAGMDEMKRLSSPSLVDIGLELVSRSGWPIRATPSCLQDVFSLTAGNGQGAESAEMAHDMLRWATRPSANLGSLLGLALAFLELKDAVADAPGLLGEDSRLVLRAIVARERQSLDECVQELKSVDRPQYIQLVQGYRLGRSVLEKCL